jgi:hypothetical protein
MHHFETMPTDAKAWIYAANRKLTPDEKNKINAKIKQFVSNWTAHEQQLKASIDVLHDLFFVIMVDENYNAVSGCGIDKSIHFMQEVEMEFNIKLFNRMQIELMSENEIIITSKSDAAKLYNEGKINDETIFLNKNITTKKEFDTNFIIPFNQSWAYQGIKNAQLT